MNTKPLTFNGDMVRALLDGRKTQTRRPVKNVRNDNRIKVGKHLVSHVMDGAKWCPIGQPGDLLYVRETFSDLTLRITDVRVERVQDINREDALAEGLTMWPHEDDFAYGYKGCAEAGHATPTGAFRALWDSIYKNWNDNPWVWVVEFEVIHMDVDKVLVVTT